MGDTLANVLSAAGYRVEKEYYVNDAGGQIALSIAPFTRGIAKRWVGRWRFRLTLPRPLRR